MSRSSFEPIHIPDHAWRHDSVRRILRDRRAGELFWFAQKHGISQMRMAAAIGQSQSRINDLMHGRRKNIEAFDAWERIADGLNMPDYARTTLGLAPKSHQETSLGSGQSVSADLGLTLPSSPGERTETVSQLWRADLDNAVPIVSGKIDLAAWNDTSLKWLLQTDSKTAGQSGSGSRHVGMSDVQRLRLTTELFAQMDNRFGGGHARHSLIQFLASDVEQLLSGNFIDEVGRDLFSAVAEATLLAAWMSYDSGLHGLAQRYFIQALALAESANDKLLAGSIFDAMSHQATFVGRFQEAANLAKAARLGTQAVATPTLTAHFHVMEGRALARLGDARGCDSALSEAVKAFEKRNPVDDPEWIQYFDEAELAAEFGHCFRDLGRPVDATNYAAQSLGNADGTYQRSDFFATMVLADSHLRAGEAEQACQVTLDALRIGEQLKSARCVSYLQEFRTGLAGISSVPVIRDFEEQAAGFSLWTQAGPPAN